MKRSILLLLLLSAVLYQSCIKKDFDAPPDTSYYNPDIPVNMTIKTLFSDSLGLIESYADNPVDTASILEDYTISGIVTANDRSGNLYKQIVIDDSSAGITVLIDANGLYAQYPVGRRIYIHLKGLYIGYYRGLPQLGYVPDAQLGLTGIPATRLDDHIIKGSVNNALPIFEVEASEVGYKGTSVSANPDYFNRLVRINNMRFIDTANTYSEPNTSTSRDVLSCNGFTVIARTSNFANFAANKLPYKIGSITGIYTVFYSGARATPQLVIRDSSDVQFTMDNCEGSGPVAGVLLTQDFGAATSGVINLAGWTNWGTADGVKFKYGNGGGASNKPYAQVTAFQSNLSNVNSWLVTPAINLTDAQNPKLTFSTAAGYSVGGTEFKVMVSTNYTAGADPATADWTELTATMATPPNSGYSDFIGSGNIDLSSFAGQQVFIAWKYVNGNSNPAETWELDDIMVTKSN